MLAHKQETVPTRHIDEAEACQQLQREIKLLLATCQTLQGKGLGGEAIDKAIVVFQELLEAMQEDT